MVKKKESGGVYYSSGEFARMAQITVRTVRYYDKQNILKPSLVTPTGARFYTEEDFARLQQIMLLKYLGFSLEDIRELTVNDSDYSYLEHSLERAWKTVSRRSIATRPIYRQGSDYIVYFPAISRGGFLGSMNNARSQKA